MAAGSNALRSMHNDNCRTASYQQTAYKLLILVVKPTSPVNQQLAIELGILCRSREQLQLMNELLSLTHAGCLLNWLCYKLLAYPLAPVITHEAVFSRHLVKTVKLPALERNFLFKVGNNIVLMNLSPPPQPHPVPDLQNFLTTVISRKAARGIRLARHSVETNFQVI